MKRIACALVACALAAPAAAHDFGFAGILSNTNQGEDLPTFVLGSGKPITDGPITLDSGKVYEMEIEADGSAELALEGPGFFRNIWVNEVVVNGLEIRPYGLESVEFDQAGTMEIEFIAIKPGQYFLRIPGSSGDAQRVDITIR